MSKPPINPDKSLAGIAVDPRTLERIIPESKRSDGTVRKERKIRPGFTPQEDVSRFRGSKQAQMDARALPKGHIVGWSPPSNTASSTNGAGLSKSQKKNQKRKEKREAEVSKKIKDNWEDEDEDDTAADAAKKDKVIETEADRPNDDGLADELQKLEVK